MKLRRHRRARHLATALAGSLVLAAGLSAIAPATAAAPAYAPVAVPRADPPPPACGTLGIPASLDGYAPGDLIGHEVVPIPNDKKGVPLLTDGIAWRILYVSTGVDETDLELVCGLVAAPTAWVPDDDGRGRMVAWAHGTVGLRQDCQPSNSPDTGFFGPTPGGIGAVAWGSLTVNESNGTAADGILQGLITEGYIVAATDYFSGIMPSGYSGPAPYQHYAAGMPSAANVLDSVRAAIAIMREEYPTQASRWEMVTWGHSQGGGAALWAGQLARRYLALTSPTVPVPPIRLVGVAAEAPASQFAPPSTALTQLQGYHLGDIDMHAIHRIGIGALSAQIAIGPALFSYVLPNWQQLSLRTPAPGARFPAVPATGALDMADMLASQADSPPGAEFWGLDTAPKVAALCLGKLTAAEAGAIAIDVAPYLQPAKAYFFVPQIWGTPETGYKVGQLDKTCATTTDAGIRAWCRWLRFNQPGPNGQNPFDKVPRNDRGLVPVYVMQGMDDDIIHCINSGATVPAPQDCLARQYVDSMRPAYCPRFGAAGGSLQFGVWPKQTGAPYFRPSNHMTIPGQVATATNARGGIDSGLSFRGSPLHDFFDAAFNDPGDLPSGCVTRVMSSPTPIP